MESWGGGKVQILNVQFSMKPPMINNQIPARIANAGGSKVMSADKLWKLVGISFELEHWELGNLEGLSPELVTGGGQGIW